MNTPKLSIIIVNWNVQELLASCLLSIDRNVKQLALPFVETIVIDNASTDGSVAMVREQFPWVKLVANQENSGFAKANNQGIALCTGEYILLLNPDTKLHDFALQRLVIYLDDHPEAGAVGPYLENPDGTLQYSCYPTPSLRRECLRLLNPNRVGGHGAYPMHEWSAKQPRAVDVIQGACLMIPRKVFQQVGLLDESFFIYTEEVDLCTRIQQANWQLVWVPTARVVHYGGQSTRQVATQMFLQLYASKVTYFRKHRGPLVAWLYKLLLTLVSITRIVGVKVAGMRKESSKPHHESIAENYRQLLHAIPTI